MFWHIFRFSRVKKRASVFFSDSESGSQSLQSGRTQCLLSKYNFLYDRKFPIVESVLSCGVSKNCDPHSGLLLEQQTCGQMLLSRDMFTSRPGVPLYGSGLCHINNCGWIMAIFLQISLKLMTAVVSYAACAKSIPIPWKAPSFS